jgi:hypothetical protein
VLRTPSGHRYLSGLQEFKAVENPLLGTAEGCRGTNRPIRFAWPRLS